MIIDTFWFDQRLIWRAGHVVLGWQASLSAVNHLFGFDIFNGKYLRLFLYFVSMVCLADLLKRLLNKRYAAISLFTIGLSPTFLYFNTLVVPYGVDLLYFPICLYLILGSTNKTLYLVKTILGSFLAMLAWLSFPTFVFYLPVLSIFYFSQLAKLPKNLKIISLTLSTIVFLTPVASLYFYIQNKQWLFNYADHQGLFVATAGGSLEPSFSAFAAAITSLVNNLFFTVSAYHYQVSWGEFSGIIPIITALIIIVLPVKFMGRFKEIRLLTITILMTAAANIILNSLSPQSVGAFRRSTPLIAAFYGFLVISFYVLSQKVKIRVILRLRSGQVGGIRVILGLLLLHHLIVYPLNLQNLSLDNPSRQPIWFARENTPKESVDKLMATLTKKDLYLNCSEEYPGNDIYCPYTPIFVILSGECSKRGVVCHNIYGYFPFEKVYHELNPDLLLNYDQQRIY